MNSHDATCPYCIELREILRRGFKCERCGFTCFKHYLHKQGTSTSECNAHEYENGCIKEKKS